MLLRWKNIFSPCLLAPFASTQSTHPCLWVPSGLAACSLVLVLHDLVDLSPCRPGWSPGAHATAPAPAPAREHSAHASRKEAGEEPGAACPLRATCPLRALCQLLSSVPQAASPSLGCQRPSCLHPQAAEGRELTLKGNLLRLPLSQHTQPCPTCASHSPGPLSGQEGPRFPASSEGAPCGALGKAMSL